VAELKEKYDITINQDAKAYFQSILSDAYFKGSWKLPEDFEDQEFFFKINNKDYSYDDFGKHLISMERAYRNRVIDLSAVIDKEFDNFFQRSILKYREENLEFENEEFAHILNEYRDGLLLFDLMEKEVWNKASKDSTGLKLYYDKNKSKYSWGERIEMVMVSSVERAIVDTAKEMMQAGKSEEDIAKKLNINGRQNVIFTKGSYPVASNKLPEDLEVKEGVSKIYEHNEAFHVLDIKSVIPEGIKTFEEAKGAVINDYQAEIEKNWLEELYNRFQIEINEKELKAVKRKLKKS
jgi:peptidyl-prolyl cis-trans isomerase SurA